MLRRQRGKPSEDGEEASSPGLGGECSGTERRALRGGEASTPRDKTTVFKHDEKDEPDYVETGREVTQTDAGRRSSSSRIHHVLALV